MTYDYDIAFTIRTATDGGPTMLKSSTTTTTSYKLLKATAAKSGGTAEVLLTPIASSPPTFFALKSDNYTNLTLAIDGGTPIVIDGPMMLIGAGQCALLGATCYVGVLTNADTVAAANVEIYIGQDPTAPGM